VRLESITTFAVRIPRDQASARGGAGSPALLQDASSDYGIAENYPTVYSRNLETLLVKITTSEGLTGWGEAQAPVVPEAAQQIVSVLLAPLLLDIDTSSPLRVREMLYNAMRVRGHFGGFYIDAISAVDCALWDIAGKRCGLPLCQMLGGPVRSTLPVYVSGLEGHTVEEQLASFDRHLGAGASAVKIFMADSPRECLTLLAKLRARSEETVILVDALWRLDLKSACRFAESLSEFWAGWLEAPLAPEDLAGHQQLAASSPVRIALGESYRTGYEILPFLARQAVHVLQPDIGRSGITEANQITALAKVHLLPVAPHVSIGLGPQFAAALHCAATWTNLEYVECNPSVLTIANQYLASRIRLNAGRINLPDGAGLGVEMDEEAVRRMSMVIHTAH
jgi:D-galactarolactone cycloisomerase